MNKKWDWACFSRQTIWIMENAERKGDEYTFSQNFKVWYRDQIGDELPDIRLNRTVDNFLKIKVIGIEEGKVRLQESAGIIN